MPIDTSQAEKGSAIFKKDCGFTIATRIPDYGLASQSSIRAVAKLPAAGCSPKLFTQRIAATLLGIFGGIALVLAAVGIYGVMSYSVSQRAPEIGIRMALGAGRGEVLRMVLRQGMTIVLIGLFSGLLLAMGIGKLISRLLYGVGTTDLVTFGTTAVVLLVVAVVANYVPARRATTVDPVSVIRYE